MGPAGPSALGGDNACERPSELRALGCPEGESVSLAKSLSSSGTQFPHLCNEKTTTSLSIGQVRKFVASMACLGCQRSCWQGEGSCGNSAGQPPVETEAEASAGFCSSCVGWEEPGRGRACLGLAAAGRLADGLLSGPPQGQLCRFAH